MVEKRGENDNYLRFGHKNNSKYNLEILSEDSDDFQLIKKSFHNTSRCTVGNNYNFKIKRICRVNKKRQSRKPKGIESEKILLFHGTRAQNVPGILRQGFKSSKHGLFGEGVYHSNFCSKCLLFAATPWSNKDCPRFLFINEIPTKYVTEKHEKKNLKLVLPKFCCHKYLSNPNVKEKYASDSNGSFINITEDDKMELSSLFIYGPVSSDYNRIPEYVANSNIVVPKYLVHIENVKKLVNTLFILSFIL